jgi:hypothetical protein
MKWQQVKAEWAISRREGEREQIKGVREGA